MSNTGFPKIANAGFTRLKPNLCPACVHYLQGSGLVRARGFTHICHAKSTIISDPHTNNGRCRDFEQKELDE